MRRFLALVTLAILALSPAAVQARGKPPLVLAAASLQESLTAAADAWVRAGHSRPVLSFAASSALARQIEAGGAADIYISADEPWMDDVAQKGFVQPRTRVSFLANKLVLIAPAGTRGNIRIGKGFALDRALGGGRLAMADPDAVPAGKYGKAALQNLGAWDAVAPKVARAENVRAALALVERGAAPYGIVYATDARASKAVRVAGVFPQASHPPITYPIALLKTASSPDAEPFRRFLVSRQGKAIFARYGFTPR